MKLEFPFECPKCGRKHKVPFDRMHPGSSVTCGCGQVIRFTGDDMRKAQRAFDNLQRSLKKMFRK